MLSYNYWLDNSIALFKGIKTFDWNTKRRTKSLCFSVSNAFILSICITNIRSEIDDILRPHNGSIVSSIVMPDTDNKSMPIPNAAIRYWKAWLQMRDNHKWVKAWLEQRSDLSISFLSERKTHKNKSKLENKMFLYRSTGHESGRHRHRLLARLQSSLSWLSRCCLQLNGAPLRLRLRLRYKWIKWLWILSFSFSLQNKTTDSKASALLNSYLFHSLWLAIQLNLRYS